jgi:WD40 repeat protein
MPHFDVCLLDPTVKQLVSALGRASRTANSHLRQRRLDLDAARWERILRRLPRNPEGLRAWTAGYGGCPAARVILGWWTDELQRRHYRVVGCRQWSRDAGRYAPVLSGAGWPVAFGIYPDYLWRRTQKGRDTVLAVCPACGACGSFAAIAWTGESCGPCYDRSQEDPGFSCPRPTILRPVERYHSYVQNLAFTPDSHVLVYTDTWLVACDLVVGQRRPLGSGSESLSAFYMVLPDNESAIVMTHHGSLRRHNLKTGAYRKLGEADQLTAGLVITPDGKCLCVYGSEIILINLKTYKRQKLKNCPNGFIIMACFSPDGRVVFALDRNQGVYSVPMDGSPAAILKEPATSSVGDDPNSVPLVKLVVSRDGRYLAFNDHVSRNVFRVWDAVRREWWVSALIAHDIRDMAFVPDGSLLAVADETELHLIDSERQEEVATISWRGRWLSSLAFSSDGRTLAIGTSYGAVHLLPWHDLLHTR